MWSRRKRGEISLRAGIACCSEDGSHRTSITAIYTMAIFIAFGDGLVILKHLGFAPPIYMHWGTAIYMAIVAAFLHRRQKV